ncbi:MAG: T9SS type A sorting domain-containing protein [Chitinispirillales bacterium]|jgi:hypothetical protein|nr:T9SS type A sorting domain-containing protein [Chitinispirillales bacterium]
MGRFTKQVAGWLAAAALTVGAAGAFAADFLLADFESGDNASKMNTYFYLYSSPWADTTYPLKTQIYAELNGTTLFNSGGPDKFGPHAYLPPMSDDGVAIAGFNSNYCGGVQVRNLTPIDGDVDGGDYGGFYPATGFGIILSEGDGIGIGSSFNTATGFRFKVKAFAPGATSVKFIFKVETIKNDGALVTFMSPPAPANAVQFNPANAYAIKITIPTGEWIDTTIRLEPIVAATLAEGAKLGAAGSGGSAGPMKQFAYWGQSFSFVKSEVTKVAWAINAEDNAVSDIDLYLDDVYILDFDWVSPDVCQGCVGEIGNIPTPSKKLSDFDSDYVDDPRQNTLGYYWFYYTDEEAGGVSEPSGLVEGGEYDPTPYVIATAGGGVGGTNGANFGFTTGPAQFRNIINDEMIAPFVGIGANLCNIDMNYVDPPSDFLNAKPFQTAGGGVYFEYKTTGIDKVYVEITDSLDAAGRAADNDGVVNYTTVPGTDGEWKSAKVPFSKLVLPPWAYTNGQTRRTGANEAPNYSRLSQIKFKYQGANAAGTMAIDNVYFWGADAWGPKDNVKLVGKQAKAVGMRATYSRGVVGVNWNTAASIASGKISLVNTKGRVVASAPIAKSGSKVTAKLGAGKLPTGMYFVRVNAKDVNGKKIVQNAPISIVK